MLKPHQIEELSQNLASEIDCSCESKVNLAARFQATIENYLQNNEAGYYELEKEDFIGTYGGEGWLDHDYHFAEYGIQLGDVSIEEITPKQMIRLAQVIVDHLLINGHRFEIQKTGEQDQTERLVCLDIKEQND